MPRVVLCGNCRFQFPDAIEASGLQGPRTPCPECGSTVREFQLNVEPGSVVIDAPAAEAWGSGPLPQTTVVDRALELGSFSRTVTFTKMDSGMWFGEMRKPDGDVVGFEVNMDVHDLYLLLTDHIREDLPSKGDPAG